VGKLRLFSFTVPVPLADSSRSALDSNVDIVLSLNFIASTRNDPVPDICNSRSELLCVVLITLSVMLMFPSMVRLFIVTDPVPAGTRLMLSLLRVAVMLLPLNVM